MTTPARLGGAALPEELAARWRSLSLSSAWLRPTDWEHAAVSHMAYSVAIGDDPRDSAWNLGRARGEIGVGIEETLDDVSCLYRALGPHPAPPTVVRALCGGWAEAQAVAVVSGTSRDPESGLPTAQYLAVRLAEACASLEPGELVVVDVAAGDVPPSIRIARSAAVGEAMTATYGPGHPMAALGGGVFVSLVRGGIDHVDLVPLLRREIDRRVADEPLRSATRCPVRIRRVDVPRETPDAEDLVRRLARS
ncbi:hypothetical protein [Cellulomonas edaphi]|uniref:Uncharacterized protein n=1 Tax=Cellulomonas edaphi TaxID=3053468 RepID=A0ABT7S2J9_9CELL|nr:hypothetical protein [Cellulomons edaphi]MDM7829843.1 hypothetical protein [Cellulomons edaphi]